MKRSVITAVVLVVLGFAVYAVVDRERRLSSVSVMSGLRVRHLLTPARIAQIPHTLGRDFDFTSSDSVLFLARDALLDLSESGSGLTVTRLTDDSRIESFAWDAANKAILTIGGGYLGQLSASGESVDALPVPPGTRLSPSSRPGIVYLHGGDPTGGHRLYVFREGGTYEILIQLPDPIGAVADNAAATYVLAGESIYRIGSDRVRHVVALNAGELGEPVISISVNREDTILFFATSRQVFALQAAVALTIVNDAGGLLRTHDDQLFVWDSKRLVLFSVGPLTALSR